MRSFETKQKKREKRVLKKVRDYSLVGCHTPLKTKYRYKKERQESVGYVR
jgi:hypothetical protein